MSLRSLMVHRCDIEVEVVLPTTTGISRTKAWHIVQKDVPCRMHPLPRYVKLEGMMQEGKSVDWIVLFDEDPGVDEHNRIVYADSTGTVHYLYVQHSVNVHEMGRLWRVECSEQARQ